MFLVFKNPLAFLVSTTTHNVRLFNTQQGSTYRYVSNDAITGVVENAKRVVARNRSMVVNDYGDEETKNAEDSTSHLR
jgi:uncharacterized spore protein YtfJ